MPGIIVKFGIDQLDVEQRLALIDAIWESIDVESMNIIRLNDAQLAELEARLLDDGDPGDLVESLAHMHGRN